jgi:D-aminoacyl-tRNA deacylase
VCQKFKVNFGHMLPNYQMEGRDDEDIVRMMLQAAEATDTKLVYLHRKSMKKPEERRISSLISSAGLEQVSSQDLDPVQ